VEDASKLKKNLMLHPFLYSLAMSLSGYLSIVCEVIRVDTGYFAAFVNC